MLEVCGSAYVPDGNVPTFKNYDEQKNKIRNVPSRETTIQQDFASDEFRCKKAMKNSFMVIGGKMKNTFVLWIANLQLLFSLKGQVGHSGR